MKKVTLLSILIILCLNLIGCAEENTNGTDAGALPPTLIVEGKNFFAKTMPIDELPDDYECIGELTDEEANNTELVGCKYYANKYVSSFDEFYVYQECGTPIDENTVDPTKRQWAYVKWIREGIEKD